MNDRLDAMAVFARVVERESFSAAARDLRLSKSAVSKHVSRLEDRMGVRLLNRTTRRVSLTEAGTAFYQGCRRVVAAAEAAEEAVTHLAAAPRGRLLVNAPMSFGVLHLAPALPEFMGSYPELTVELVFNDRLVDLVEEGFDVGVRIARLKDSSLVARRLAPNRRVLCASPNYLHDHGIPEALEDLSEHDCLLYSYQVGGDVWHFRGPGGQRLVRVTGRLRVNNGEALLAAALGHRGIALLPTFICGEALRLRHLVHVLPEWSEAGDAAVHAVYPASRNLSPKVRVFVDYLAKRFGPRPYWDRGLTA